MLILIEESRDIYIVICPGYNAVFPLQILYVLHIVFFLQAHPLHIVSVQLLI